MAILNYNNAVVDSSIRRINPVELTLREQLGGGSESDYIFAGTLDGKEIVLKAIKEERHQGFLEVEVNTLDSLQGVSGVPQLHGWVEGGLITLLSEPGKEYQFSAGIVTARAAGKPIMGVPEYADARACQEYGRRTGINIYAAIAQQLGRYCREILERRLIDADFNERNILVDAAPTGTTVTKIDQGLVQNRRDIDLEQFDRFEILPNKYYENIKYLLVLPLTHLSPGDRNDIALHNQFRRYLSSEATGSQPHLCAEFSRLINSFLDGEFNTNTFPNGRDLPDDITFLRFLDRWEKVMEEQGKSLLSS